MPLAAGDTLLFIATGARFPYVGPAGQRRGALREKTK